MELQSRILFVLNDMEDNDPEGYIEEPPPKEEDVYPWRDGCDECTKTECEREDCQFFDEMIERDQAMFTGSQPDESFEEDESEVNSQIDIECLEQEFIAYLEDHDIEFVGRLDYQDNNEIVLIGTFYGIDSEESFHELLEAWAEENEIRVMYE